MSSKLEEIFIKLFQISPDKFTDGLHQDQLETWDSMAHLILVTELEEAFDIQIEEDDILAMKTVGDIKTILTKNSITNF